MAIRENLKNNLIYLLNQNSITQKDLANKLGVSQSAVTNWIKGKNSPDIEIVDDICEIFGVDVEFIFSDNNTEDLENTNELNTEIDDSVPVLNEQDATISDFGRILRKERLALGYTQQQVAKMLGITNSTYCGYETGKRQPDIVKIREITRIFNIPSDTLLQTEFDPLIDSNQVKKKTKTDADKTSLPLYSKEEVELIKNYRTLDEYGKGLVRNDIEYRIKWLDQEVEIAAVADTGRKESHMITRRAQLKAQQMWEEMREGAYEDVRRAFDDNDSKG